MIRLSGWAKGNGQTPTTYHITIDKWVWWKYYRAKFYHKYDMIFPVKVPGFKRLVHRMGGETMRNVPEPFGEELRGLERLRSWMIEQDLRCFAFSDDCERLAVVEVSKQTYKTIRNP